MWAGSAGDDRAAIHDESGGFVERCRAVVEGPVFKQVVWVRSVSRRFRFWPTLSPESLPSSPNSLKKKVHYSNVNQYQLRTTISNGSLTQNEVLLRQKYNLKHSKFRYCAIHTAEFAQKTRPALYFPFQDFTYQILVSNHFISKIATQDT